MRGPKPPVYPRYPQPCPRLSHQFESDVIATLGIEDIFLRGRRTVSMLRELPWSPWVLNYDTPPPQKSKQKLGSCHAHSSAAKLHTSQLSWTPVHTDTHLPRLREPASSQGPTHRRVPNTAGEGHPTALTAWVRVSAVEVDIEVPVIGPSGTTARPLGRQESLLSRGTHR